MSSISLQTIGDIFFDREIHSTYLCHLSTTSIGGKEMKQGLVIFAAALLAGCVSMGTDFDETAIDSLQVGMTKAEVIGLLGQPNQVITNSDGSERLVWVHSTGSAFVANARSVGLPFDTDGLLTDIPD